MFSPPWFIYCISIIYIISRQPFYCRPQNTKPEAVASGQIEFVPFGKGGIVALLKPGVKPK
jgi:hypothetical protein